MEDEFDRTARGRGAFPPRPGGPRPPVRHRPRSRPRGWAWLSLQALLTVLLLPAFPAVPAAQGTPATPLVKLEATLKYSHPVQAAAFSADESVIAVATGEAGGTIIFSDRTSKAQLGQIATQAGAAPRLHFSPDGALLLVVGDEAMELWQVPIAPMKPGENLSRDHLRWSLPVDSGEPVTAAGFSGLPASVVWSAGGAIFRRGTAAGSPFSGGLARRIEGEGALRLSISGGGGRLVAHRSGEKALSVLQADSLRKTGELEGHRFPVVSARFNQKQALVSLDSGFNLIRWKKNGQPEVIAYLDPAPGTPAPTGMLPIASPYHLVFTGPASGGEGLIVDASKGKVRAVLKSLRPGATAVSPTGRYIAVGGGNELRLLGFAHPMAPRAYVSQLKARGALKTARSYANLLDGRGLPAGLKSQLLAQLNRAPAALGVNDFLASMNSAEQDGNLEDMVYWATKVLDIEESHPRAMAVLGRVAELRETNVFDQARAALELGEHRQAIAMLSSQVPATSPRYGEALELIRRAEHERGMETALEQARDKMNLGNYPAAQALVTQVLRVETDYRAALELQAEISQRSGSFDFEPLTFVFLAVLAVAMVGGALFRLRHVLAPILNRVSLHQPEPGRSRGGPAHAPGAAAGKNRDSAARPPPRTRDIPRHDAYEKGRRRKVQELLEMTEEMIRLARQADLRQQHSSFLLELEAEISAIHRRMTERGVDYHAVQGRLEAMLSRVRGLKFAQVAPPRGAADQGTHYDVLKLTPGASLAEIKMAYHNLLKEYHPDLHSQSSFGWVRDEAEQMSKRLGEAYDVLSNAAKRDAYNRTLPKRRSHQL